MERATAVDEVCEALASALISHYVFADEGRRAASELARRAAAHGQPATGEALAEMITEWAQRATGDRHVRVRYHADGAPAAAEAKAAFRAAFRARAREENYGIGRVAVLPRNVGLMELTNFFDATVAGPAVVEAVQQVAGCDALLIDLRRNGGGEPGTVALLCSYLFDGDPERTHLNDLITPAGMVEQWWTLPYVPGRRLHPRAPVYVLTSSRTFSAAEECAYDLQALGRALIVGERTRGGGHTVEQFRLTDQFSAMIPNGRAVNPTTGTNWQGRGVIPDVDCPAEDAVNVAVSHLQGHDGHVGRRGPE